MAGQHATNKNLTKAKKTKNDEFYTQLSDIERELKHYKKHFIDKVVYCNCDDPRVSNFFHYFSYNFERLGLKRLIATCYQSKEIDLFSQNDSNQAIYLEYVGDKNGNNIPDPDEIGITKLKGDGDFRSDESIELLKQADIIVTNPPFSLFREYVAQLMEYKKKFVIIGNKNAIKYKEIFKWIEKNQMWVGNTPMGKDMLFGVTDVYAKELLKNKKEGSAYKIIDGVVKGRAQASWLTNMDIKKRHEDMILYKKYTPEEYPKYDNYDAIEVSKTKEIPTDYSGVIGVPITFLDKYNPDQFEIVGMTSGRNEFEATPTKKYINPKQVNADGSITNGSKANTSSTILYSKKPKGVYYIADNADGYLKVLYTRFLIKNKKVVK